MIKFHIGVSKQTFSSVKQTDKSAAERYLDAGHGSNFPSVELFHITLTTLFIFSSKCFESWDNERPWIQLGFHIDSMHTKWSFHGPNEHPSLEKCKHSVPERDHLDRCVFWTYERGWPRYLFTWGIVTRLTFAMDAAEVVGAAAFISLLCVFEGISILLAPAQKFAHILSDFHGALWILRIF